MNYPNAPIREALFDIRIDKLNIEKVEELAEFKTQIKGYSPVAMKRNRLTANLESPEKLIESKLQTDLIGYLHMSENKTRQLQIRNDGLTLNILKPYENWETHFEQFISMWNFYNEMFSPNNIIRIATRYINRIEIPTPLSAFDDYITVMPIIPKCLPQTFATFFMQIQVPCKEDNRGAIITETIEPNSDSILPFILDIDVFQDHNIENSINSLEKYFSEIRCLKNEIFENCITDKTRKLFL